MLPFDGCKIEQVLVRLWLMVASTNIHSSLLSGTTGRSFHNRQQDLLNVTLEFSIKNLP